MRTLLLAVIILSVTGIALSQPELPKHRNGQFAASGNCAFCHTNLFGANTYKGKDVSQSTLWRSTMMANAKRDPFFRAKVDAEVQSVNNPAIQKAATDLCLKCHSPMGFTQASFDGTVKDYTFEKSESDLLAYDGVSCALCHQIQADNLGKPESFAGNYKIGKDRLVYGPYKDVLEMPMGVHENFKPVYGEQVKKSEFCATCHTVITPKVTENEEINGVFFEQTVFLEWKNSGYPESGINCQSCHMPAVEEAIDIAARPPHDTTKRSPFAFHQFVGGNATLQKIFIKNASELKLPSSPSYHEDKLKETETFLKESALSLGADTKLTGSDLEIKVKLENQAGHKLPSGIPFRRMWIHLTVKDNTGNTVFESGGYDKDGNIIGHDENFENHYNEITDPNQVQIYEAVMVDAKEKHTFSLLRADKFIKDNRIPPVGFTSRHPSYDTSSVYGDALNDPDFNKDAKGNEGSGSDNILYKISGVSGGAFTVEIEVLYQTLDPKMFSYFAKYDSKNIVTFATAYKNTTVTPVVLKTLSLSTK
ncbi:MAG: cytochrome c family protein [Ignavibacteria bacterium]|jgi:hypothetical protein|nr:cytochrome c family protein [Ignavibacteria bacterium]